MLLDLVQPFLTSCSEPWTCENFNSLIVSITLQRVRLKFFTVPSMIVPSFYRLKACIFKPFKPLVSFSYAIWSTATFFSSYSEPSICGNFDLKNALQPVWFGFFTHPSTIVPSLHQQRAHSFKLFTLLASSSCATWSSATFLASCSEPWTCGNFNTQIVYTTSQRIRLAFFTVPSTIVPSLHRQKVCIFKPFTPLASFPYAIRSSTTFLASFGKRWTWVISIRW